MSQLPVEVRGLSNTYNSRRAHDERQLQVAPRLPRLTATFVEGEAMFAADNPLRMTAGALQRRVPCG